MYYNVLPWLQCTRCGYEVPGMILLQGYLYTYNLLRGVTFEVLPLNSYILNDAATVANILEYLLWSTFQCRHFVSKSLNFRPLKADFVFEKSFTAK
jgi:hypothetical protein